MNGLFASICGLTAGSIGITISCSRNSSRLKCFWRAYATLISLAVFGSIGSIIASFFTILYIGFSHQGRSNKAYETAITEAILSVCMLVVCNVALFAICLQCCQNNCNLDQSCPLAIETQRAEIGSNNDAFRSPTSNVAKI